jgi:signal transduction histidine kinase/DNA-binding response OmpR family regulator
MLTYKYFWDKLYYSMKKKPLFFSFFPICLLVKLNTGTCFVLLAYKVPWYFSAYAIALYGIILTTFIFIYKQFLINREKRRARYHIKELEAQRWQEIDALKSSFFANISHELRTPLTLIMAPLQEMMNKQLPKKDALMMKMMYWNSNRLLFMINEILDLSKLDAGKMNLKISKIKIAELSEPILQSFQVVTNSSNKIFHYEMNDPDEFIYCDVDKIEKVISNLLSNSFKYTYEKGMISFRCRKITHLPEGIDMPISDEYFELAVFDNGKGIPNEIQPRIFERFFTHHQDFESSTGIGLSLTKEFINMHHGCIKVESEPGVFTAFYVYLPKKIHSLDDHEVVPVQTLQRKADFSYIELDDLVSLANFENSDEEDSVILIIEDNKKLRYLLTDMLNHRFKVITASNGEQGLEMARKELPDVIISDVMMPGLSGFQLCKEIKKDLFTSHIPIILLTAKAATEDKFKGLSSGADDYIVKPFHNQEILLKVQNMINNRNLLRKHYNNYILGKEKHTINPLGNNKFLDTIRQVLEDNYADSSFNVDAFAQIICMSRVQLHRKIKALTNQSTSNFIRNYRLEKSKLLIANKDLSISQVAYQVGFSNPSYFTESFKKYFGELPSCYNKK